MAVGANDHIDRLLVRKYADLQVDKHEATELAELAVPPQKMYEIMNDYAASHKMMLGLQSKLKQVSQKLQSTGATRCYAKQSVV